MKKVYLFLMIMVLVFILIGCNKIEQVDSNKLNIVTSFYPMYIATSNIVDGIEDVKLTNMTKTEVGCLHDYQLTTKDMNILEKADIFIVNGGGMESFLNKAISAYPKLNIINASEGILEDINKTEEHEDEEEHDEHDHNHEQNAHVWVSISMYIEQIKNISEELGKIDEKNKDKYLENAEKYIEKLEQLKEQMHEALDNAKNKNIVTFHEAFDLFAQEFNLNIVAVIEREPGTSPSAGELSEIIEKIKSVKATAIFVEPQYEASIADVIARETNVHVYTLDPVVTGELDKDSYQKIMTQNMEVLKEALR